MDKLLEMICDLIQRGEHRAFFEKFQEENPDDFEEFMEMGNSIYLKDEED